MDVAPTEAEAFWLEDDVYADDVAAGAWLDPVELATSILELEGSMV